LLSGEQYIDAIVPMRIMLPTLLFIGLTNLMGIQILVPMGKEEKVLESTIVGAMIDLILNMILIPKYSVVGAAIGTVTAEFMVFIYQYFSARTLFKELFKNINTCPYIISTIIATLSSVWTLHLEIGTLMILLLSSMCFGIVYLLCLLILKDYFIQEIIGRVLIKAGKKE
jgi:O-antigen transporter